MALEQRGWYLDLKVVVQATAPPQSPSPEVLLIRRLDSAWLHGMLLWLCTTRLKSAFFFFVEYGVGVSS